MSGALIERCCRLAIDWRPTMQRELVIKPLADRPELVSLLARWFHAEWSEIDGRSLISIEAQLNENLSPDSVPITFLAESNDQIVGTVSLDVADFPSLDHLTPWVASLYVVPSARGHGVGTTLLRHVQNFAKARKLEPVYLWTLRDTRFFENCGWRTLRHTTYNSHPVTVMRLSAQTAEFSEAATL